MILAGLFLAARIAVGIIEKPDAATGVAGVEVADLVRWVPPDSAVDAARIAGRPILYDFAADWCAPCRAMKEELFADVGAAAFINDTFVPCRINDRAVEEGRNDPLTETLQKTYRVRAFPTLVVVATGREPFRLEGFPGREETIRWLKETARGSAVGGAD